MALFDDMLARAGMTRADVLRGTTRVGKLVREGGVPPSAELDRIVALPRRSWEDHGDGSGAELVDGLTGYLKTEGGQMRLRLAQAVALAELHDHRGLLGLLAVGEGKTLVTLLAGTVLEIDRVVLFVPASLRDKTRRDAERYAAHWKITMPRIFSYEELGRVDRDGRLEEAAPLLIVADEAHRLKNRDAAVTRRAERYLSEHPETIFAALSGTLTRRSLMDWHHLARWALGDKEMPLPRSASETQRWADAIDAEVEPGNRLSLGALSVFGAGLNEVREGLGLRVRETTGVVAPKVEEIAASIRLTRFDMQLPLVIVDAMRRVEETELDFDGEELFPDEAAVLLDQLPLGFYLRWRVAGPPDWMDARRRWHRVVREVLDARMDGIDSSLQVAIAVDAGRFGDVPEWRAWVAVRDAFKPDTVPVWLSYAVVDAIAKLQPYRDDGTLIWCHHRALGQAFRERGLRYFGSGGRDETGSIEDVEGAPTVALSVAANAEGRNLQRWSRAIVTAPSPAAATWEQTFFGRIHRFGQTADEVEVVVNTSTKRYRDALDRARREAEYLSKLNGQQHKLLLADWD